MNLKSSPLIQKRSQKQHEIAHRLNASSASLKFIYQEQTKPKKTFTTLEMQQFQEILAAVIEEIDQSIEDLQEL